MTSAPSSVPKSRSTLKRIVLWALALFGVALLAIALVFVASFAGLPPVQDGEELGDVGVVVKDGYTSLDILRAGNGQVALIDAGADVKGEALLAALKKQGLTADSVRAIFLTHGHPDHTAGCHLFPRAEVYALAEDVALAEGRGKAHGPVTQFIPAKDTGVRVTHALRDGDVVPVGTLNVHVYAVPGHTAGSAAYQVRNVLFGGDSADATKDGKLTSAKWVVSDDATQNRRSLVTLADRLVPEKTVELLVASHTGTLKGLGVLEALGAKLK